MKNIEQNTITVTRNLGLDLGTSSIGWSLVDIYERIINNKKELIDFEIIDSGVRLFKEMTHPKTGEPLNAQRRSKRGARRLLQRKVRRRTKVFIILQQIGVLFTDSILSINKQIKQYKKNTEHLDPYTLRVKALDYKLEPEEFFKVIYHINQRRGFRSNRKDKNLIEKHSQELQEKLKQEAEKKDMSLEKYARFLLQTDKGGSNVKKSIEILRVCSAQYRSLGDYFYSLKKMKIRGIYLDRKLLEEELEVILNKQSEFYPQLNQKKSINNYKSFWENLRKIDTNKDMLLDAIFEPRPLKSQEHLIGRCPYYKDEKRSPCSSLIFQEYNLLTTLNNVKIRSSETNLDNPIRPLTLEEKQKIIDQAKRKKNINWEDVKKILNLSEEESINFQNQGSKNKVPILMTYQSIKSALGEHFEKIWQEHIVLQYKSDITSGLEELIQAYSSGEVTLYKKIDQFVKQYHLPTEIKENLESLEIDYSNDYSSYSQKMLKQIVPFTHKGILKNGIISFKEYDILEYLQKEKIIPTFKEFVDIQKPKDLNKMNIESITFNPRVKKMLFELRKLFKALATKYHIDDMQKDWVYKVEMAREMKKGEAQKNNIIEKQTFLQRIREQAREAGAKNKEDENKFLLWEEQEKLCAYCSLPLNPTAVFSNHTEIDHIIPISRIPDDSMQNKVLSCRSCNQEKKNRTPKEAFEHKPQWQKILDHLGSITSKKTKAYKEAEKSKQNDISDDIKKLMNYGKLLRIQWAQEDIDKARENFSSRQLNETRFGSKEAIKFLETFRGRTDNPKDKKITTTKGGFTHRIKKILNIDTSIKYSDSINAFPSDSLLAVALNSSTKKDNQKQRSDHRHHAIDAFAMTFIGPSFENRTSQIEKDKQEILQLLSIEENKLRELDENQLKKQVESLTSSEKQKNFYLERLYIYKKKIEQNSEKLSLYYQNIIKKIQKELPKHLENIIISHAHNRKIQDALHEETVFGVKNIIPVSYIDKNRLEKLKKDNYISKSLYDYIWQYIDKHKFLPLDIDDQTLVKKEEAKDIVLYAFRRGDRTKGDYPPALEIPAEFWQDKHGPVKKDHIPLLKAVYTEREKPKKSDTEGKEGNTKNLAVVVEKEKILKKLDFKEKIEAEYKTLTNQDKKKLKDFTLQDLQNPQCTTLYQAVQELLKKENVLPQNIEIYDEFINQVKADTELNKVLLLDFASRKFTPQSKLSQHKSFDMGNNHHMAIFERVKKDKKGNIMDKPDGTPEIERRGIIITTLDVATRARRKVKPQDEKDKVIYRYYHNYEPQYKTLPINQDEKEWQFIFSLCAGDYVKLDDGLFYKVYKMSQNEIYISYIQTYGEYDGKKTPKYAIKIQGEWKDVTSGLKGASSLLNRIENKYYVGVLGELTVAHD